MSPSKQKVGIWNRRPSCGLTWMMANPLLFWAWSAPGSFWAWRALVASFWPGVPWLIFGLECLGSFWRPGEPLVEFFRPGVPLVCFGLECLVSFWAWSAPGYAVVNREPCAHGSSFFGRLSPVFWQLPCDCCLECTSHFLWPGVPPV